MASDTETPPSIGAGDLPRLIARLVERSIFFLEQRIALAEDEVRQQIRRAVAASGWIAAALILALVGFGLASAGVFVLLARWGVPLWLTLLAGGLLYIGIGALLVFVSVRRARGRRVLGRSLAELDKDRTWLRGQG